MKVNTVEQFKCLEWIKQNFRTESLEIILLNNTTIRIKDRDGSSANVSYINDEVSIEYHEEHSTSSLNEGELASEDYYLAER